MPVSPDLWESVYTRDRGRCVLFALSPQVGPCTNRWGDAVRRAKDGSYHRSDVTFAHIKMMPGGARRDDERHAVVCCWGHHVTGKMDITASRHLETIRSYLRKLYGDNYD